MPSKKQRSGDPLSWIQDTTDKDKTNEGEAPEPTEKARGKSGETEAGTESPRKRSIFVQYEKADGQILSTHEVLQEFGQDQRHPWTTIPENREAAAILLTGDLVDKELIEIHQNYRVDFSKNKPTLVLKA